jgi:hypothetical protein
MAYTFNGIGTTYYGSADRRADGSYVATEWFGAGTISLRAIQSRAISKRNALVEGSIVSCAMRTQCCPRSRSASAVNFERNSILPVLSYVECREMPPRDRMVARAMLTMGQCKGIVLAAGLLLVCYQYGKCKFRNDHAGTPKVLASVSSIGGAHRLCRQVSAPMRRAEYLP